MSRSRIGPDPVSCQSCRSKKLRCNRVQPCSNCTSRGITCQFLLSTRRRGIESPSTIQNNAQILKRIERLESLVLSTHGSQNAHLVGLPPVSSGIAETVTPNICEQSEKVFEDLENIGSIENSPLPPLSKHLAFTILDGHEILNQQYRLNNITERTIAFPTYQIAISLFESYETTVDHVCRIMHIPTVRSMMKAAYLRISQSESIPPGQAALLLAVFSLGAFFYQSLGNHGILTSERDASQISGFLCKGALDVLDYSHRNASGTIEDVQALILMCYVTYHLDGFSARYRLLLAQASSVARDLCLHRLDANDQLAEDGETAAQELVECEVKRRVFWHIAATDWLLSVVSGPQEGTYFIHPQHANVRLPKDCSDDEIHLSMDNGPVVEPQPTGMTFFLERVRLAHICREVTDILPLETSKLVQIPYEQIIILDKKFQDFFSSLPFFFRVDSESRQKSKILEIVYTNIDTMRYCITTIAHSRRCRLHQKFLLRQSFNNRYAYSRKACLESARAIIQIHEDPPQMNGLRPKTKAQIGMAVHFIHLGLVVMVMDLCINKDVPCEEGSKEEVKATLEMLEGARNISPILGRSLDSLYDVLKKYNISLSANVSSDSKEVPETAPETEIGDFDPLYHVYMQSTQLGLCELSPGTNFDGFSQNLTPPFETDLSLITWDNLFSAVDSRPF